MGAPAGNQFWKLRSRHGRKKLFETPDLLWEAACEFFQWCDDNPWTKKETITKMGDTINQIDTKEVPTQRPYTIEGFCLYCDASTTWWREFKSAKHQDFLSVIERIEQIIYKQKFEGAAVGAFNANIIARDLGLKDKTEHTGKNGGPITTKALDKEEYAKVRQEMLDLDDC